MSPKPSRHASLDGASKTRHGPPRVSPGMQVRDPAHHLHQLKPDLIGEGQPYVHYSSLVNRYFGRYACYIAY